MSSSAFLPLWAPNKQSQCNVQIAYESQSETHCNSLQAKANSLASKTAEYLWFVPSTSAAQYGHAPDPYRSLNIPAEDLGYNQAMDWHFMSTLLHLLWLLAKSFAYEPSIDSQISKRNGPDLHRRFSLVVDASLRSRVEHLSWLHGHLMSMSPWYRLKG